MADDLPRAIYEAMGYVEWDRQPEPVRAMWQRGADAAGTIQADRIATLQARVERMRVALEPFAAMAGEIERVAGAQGWALNSIRRSYDYDQCVAARQALASEQEGEA